MNVLFRADASDSVGTGHLMRCMTLGSALRKNGATVTFACRPLAASTGFAGAADALAAAGHDGDPIDAVVIALAGGTAGGGSSGGWGSSGGGWGGCWRPGTAARCS